jgi:hypothetical protein
VSVITAVVTHAPENVTHTRPSEPWPWRVTITVACSPLGVEVGSVALNVSCGVLMTYHLQGECGTPMAPTPAGSLVRLGPDQVLWSGRPTIADEALRYALEGQLIGR